METWDAKSTEAPDAILVELVYELLDAHGDTIFLAEEHSNDLRWAAHIEYLRSLQRVGREALAASSARPIAAVPLPPAPGSPSHHHPG